MNSLTARRARAMKSMLVGFTDLRPKWTPLYNYETTIPFQSYKEPPSLNSVLLAVRGLADKDSLCNSLHDDALLFLCLGLRVADLEGIGQLPPENKQSFPKYITFEG